MSPTIVPFPERTVAAADVSPAEASERIAQLLDHVVDQIRGGQTPYIDVPDLHSANAIYDEDGNVFLGSKTRQISLYDAMTFTRILLTAQLASELLRSGTRATKRGLYYHHQTKLPATDRSQTDTDQALAALANVLRVRRKNLSVLAARKGTVSGSLVIRDGDTVIDLSQMRSRLFGIPDAAEPIEIVESKAKFILVVEKESVAVRLAEIGWSNTHPCVMICDSGFPSFGTRELTRKLVDELRLPVFALTDGDPAGLRVALTHAHGGISTALETPWLVCKDVNWVGLHASDVERFDLPKRYDIKLTEEDIESAQALLDHPSTTYVKSEPRRELELLLSRGRKMELDAPANLDLDFFARTYLPRKLFETEPIRL